MINAHYEDGLALTKFIYWIKHNKKKINELMQKKLENFRRKVKIIFILASYYRRIQKWSYSSLQSKYEE